ncbi:hypothetical protein C0J52_13206 [Blattella germanica]|nr:hypothetical protein C0J52_13206 [Blattella germanica]
MDNNTGGLHKFDMTNLGLKTLKVVLCSGMQIHKIKEPLSGMRFTTQEDISIAVRQQMTRFTHAFGGFGGYGGAAAAAAGYGGGVGVGALNNVPGVLGALAAGYGGAPTFVPGAGYGSYEAMVQAALGAGGAYGAYGGVPSSTTGAFQGGMEYEHMKNYASGYGSNEQHLSHLAALLPTFLLMERQAINYNGGSPKMRRCCLSDLYSIYNGLCLLGKSVVMTWGARNKRKEIRVNKELYDLYKESNIIAIIRNDRLRCLDIQDSRPAKRVLLNNQGGQRYRDTARTRWEDGVEEEEGLEYVIGLAERKTKDLQKLLETARALNELSCCFYC